MNKKQYNNVIENTLKHEHTDDSLSTARAIFNNMGVALPQGDMKTVYETIKTDNYMGWKSCTMQEAQAAADNGTAAIGISENRIVVLSAKDEEQPVAQTASVMTLDENTSAFAVDGLQYYSYSYGGTGQGGGNSTLPWRKAIIIVPGVMGTELELATATDDFSVGTKVWPPYESGESVGLSAVNKLSKLQCDTSGNSVYNLRVRNTNNYGALNSYKKLYTELKNTYGDNYDVIFFGYDWRKPNSVSGSLLKNKVEQYDSVIIVAHSMGGLVTSHMLTNYSIRSKIEKVITLGTPYLGSLEMLPVMSHGELEAIDNALSNLWEPLAWVAKELILQPVLQAMAVNIPSLYELLPTKKFFSLGNRSYYSIWYLIGGDTPLNTFANTRTYLSVAIPNYNSVLFDEATARNDSLWNGNNHVTSNVNTYYIAGESKATPNTYTFNHATGAYSTTSVSAGDGTVLSYSASMNDIYPGKTFFVNANHNNLVKYASTPDVIGFVKAIINGSTLYANGIKSFPQYTL